MWSTLPYETVVIEASERRRKAAHARIINAARAEQATSVAADVVVPMRPRRRTPRWLVLRPAA